MSEQLELIASIESEIIRTVSSRPIEPSGNYDDQPETLREVEEFPPHGEIAHGELLSLTLSTKTSGLTHGLHRFPAKYIPQVPRWALNNYATEASVVLDPFMGSGTSLVEALCSVDCSYGTDIDPLARLITAAKTGDFDPSKLKSLSMALSPSQLPHCAECFLPMEGVKNVTHWFSEAAWQSLSRIYLAIERLQCSQAERNFFFAVFSSTLRWVSNADDQTQKTYVSGTLKKVPPDVFQTFEKFLQRALTGISSLASIRGTRQTRILEGSALSVPLADASVDLIITSPPYLDSVDYMYNFMLEYFWLGPMLGVSSRGEYNKRRRLPIGAKNPVVESSSIHESLVGLVDLQQIPEYRREAALAYFDLMQKHFVEAARVMKDGARYVLVVGNSQASTGVLPVHDCLLRLAKTAGLHLEKAFAYRIRRHYMKFPRKGRGGIILMDWVITLKKTTGAILENEDRLPIPRVSIGADEVAN
ncbi:DNA methylase [Paraburkholderia eburnea]|uniref:site-specific DNA-methyltransferase (cytosine-N(4)-specific) n=1 Tax=Paraburkholderia eburnea TaxID=1189126 RepID=A0A2S4LX54_9BURK|nr:site-specific DNA-methyltransferase [Paraburkholderia eburnea]POR47040.1 DNA methylase [Paraburkholderia eburnea]PRZ18270.1 DNA methylase [Paraburkholderia eburnea]